MFSASSPHEHEQHQKIAKPFHYVESLESAISNLSYSCEYKFFASSHFELAYIEISTTFSYAQGARNSKTLQCLFHLIIKLHIE